MMIKASKFAIAIAVVAPIGIATAGNSLAAPVSPSAITAKAPAPTEVQYRTYFDYGYGPYTYRPAYRYGGYTYWYPSYRNWAYPGDYYYNWW
jgi:hypothetical protein